MPLIGGSQAAVATLWFEEGKSTFEPPIIVPRSLLPGKVHLTWRASDLPRCWSLWMHQLNSWLWYPDPLIKNSRRSTIPKRCYSLYFRCWSMHYACFTNLMEDRGTTGTQLTILIIPHVICVFTAWVSQIRLKHINLRAPDSTAPHAMKTDVADLAKLGLGLCGAAVVARILWKLKSGAQGALPESKKDRIENVPLIWIGIDMEWYG